MEVWQKKHLKENAFGVETIERLLSGLNKKELGKLLEMLVEVNPDNGGVLLLTLLPDDEIIAFSSIFLDYFTRQAEVSLVHAVGGGELFLERVGTTFLKGKYETAVTLYLSVLSAYLPILKQFDDSEGVVGFLVDRSINGIHNAVLQIAKSDNADEMKKRIFSMIRAEITKPSYHTWLDWRSDLLQACICLCENDEIRTEFEEMICALVDELEGTKYYKQYVSEQLKETLFSVVRAFGSEEEIRAFVSGNLSVPYFREIAIQMAISDGHYEFAMSLCNSKKWAPYLFDIYGKMELFDEQKEVARGLVQAGYEEFYPRLKMLYTSKEELSIVREELLTHLSDEKESSVYRMILKDTGDKDRLLAYVKEFPDTIPDIAEEIIDTNWDSVREMYEAYLLAHWKKNENRAESFYRQFGVELARFESLFGEEITRDFENKVADGMLEEQVRSKKKYGRSQARTKAKATELVLPESVSDLLFLLNEAGHDAYIVGGCVRDSLLGKTPDDWDVCTSAQPEVVRDLFVSHDMSVIETGMKHGTVTVFCGKMPIEVTTYRIDGTYSDGRRPDEVMFTKEIAEDLRRRDFTMNAIAYHPEAGLIDVSGGYRAIKEKVIRAVGEPHERFAEDGLRILRMFRFAAVLEFRIDTDTLEAAVSMKNMLSSVSKERIRDEFLKILLSRRPSNYLRLMEESGILSMIVPEYADAVGFEQHSSYHHLTVSEHTLSVIDHVESDIVLRLAAFYHDLGKPAMFTMGHDGYGHFRGHPEMSMQIARRSLGELRFPKSVIREVCLLIENHDIFLTGQRRQMRRMVAKIGAERTETLLKLQKADGLAKHPRMRRRSLSNVQKAREELYRVSRDMPPVSVGDLVVNGNDLIALGVPKGLEIGHMLERIRSAVIEEKVQNQKDKLLEEIQKGTFH